MRIRSTTLLLVCLALASSANAYWNRSLTAEEIQMIPIMPLDGFSGGMYSIFDPITGELIQSDPVICVKPVPPFDFAIFTIPPVCLEEESFNSGYWEIPEDGFISWEDWIYPDFTGGIGIKPPLYTWEQPLPPIPDLEPLPLTPLYLTGKRIPKRFPFNHEGLFPGKGHFGNHGHHGKPDELENGDFPIPGDVEFMVPFANVPEPTTILLLSTGALALIRRKK